MASMVFCLVLCAFVKVDPSLTGKWVAKEKGEISEITFDKSGYISFLINDKVFGGKNYSVQNMTVDMTYEVYTRAKPHNIDLILIAQGSLQEVRRIRGIYDMENPNTLRVKFNFQGAERPNNFNTEEDDGTMVFERAKE